MSQNPIVRIALYTLLSAVAILLGSYVRQVVVDHGAFSPNFIQVAITSVACGIAAQLGMSMRKR